MKETDQLKNLFESMMRIEEGPSLEGIAATPQHKAMADAYSGFGTHLVDYMQILKEYYRWKFETYGIDDVDTVYDDIDEAVTDAVRQDIQDMVYKYV